MNEIREKVNALKAEVASLFVGRSREVDLAVSALVANEHAVLIGDPGCAKSAVIEQVATRIGECDYFGIQLFPETSPSDVFGQVSLRALQEEDVNRRNTVGHLPNAHIGYLDEIFQARSSILVGCNRIMQERKYMNGCETVDVPLRTMFGASNFFPEDKQLAAFWDRFTYRHIVQPLATDEDITAMLMMPDPTPGEPLLTLAELDQAHADAMSLPVPQGVVIALLDVMNKFAAKVLETTKFAVKTSDRKRKKALKAMKVAAYLSGANEVTTSSMLALRYVLWERQEHVAILDEILAEYAVPCFDDIEAGLIALSGECESVRTVTNKETRGRMLRAVFGNATSFREDLLGPVVERAGLIGGEAQRKVKGYEDTFNALMNDILREMGLEHMLAKKA